MSHERTRKRVLRLKTHIATLKSKGLDAASFEAELSALITGKRKPKGTTVNPKVVTRTVRVARGN